MRKFYDSMRHMPLEDLMNRPANFQFECPWAISFGTITTRCKKPLLNHGDSHEGRGLEQFPYQVIEWFKGDRREFKTTREDFYAWED